MGLVRGEILLTNHPSVWELLLFVIVTTNCLFINYKAILCSAMSISVIYKSCIIVTYLSVYSKIANDYQS